LPEDSLSPLVDVECTSAISPEYQQLPDASSASGGQPANLTSTSDQLNEVSYSVDTHLANAASLSNNQLNTTSLSSDDSPTNASLLDDIDQLTDAPSSCHPDSAFAINEAFHIHLVPSPFSAQMSASATRGPTIEIILGIDPRTKEYSLSAVQACTHHRVIDLLRPDRACDIRFTSHSYISLDNVDTDENLKAFLDGSSLDLRGQERLRTPSSLKMRLPRWVLTSEKGSEVGDTTEKDVDVEYMFKALEHRQTIDLTLEGKRAEWVNVEGGITGGRRAEFRMYR
jgi:hypothetical protein